jgi:putative intracellular protease/amidase
MAQRALIVLTNNDQLGQTGKPTGFYLSEVTHVYYPLVEAGFSVELASPRGGRAPLDEASRKLDDPDNHRFVGNSALMARLDETWPLSEVVPRDYAVLHFAGGHGVMWDFPGDPEIGRVVAGVYANGGIVAAVCHGPAALVDVKLADGSYLVANHDVSAFTNAEEREVGLSEVVPFLLQSKLEERGARVQAGANWQSQVSVSGRLVTGQNPQSAKVLASRIIDVAARLG